MKHNLKVVSLMLLLFLVAQVIGLVVVSHYNTNELPFGIERPEVEPDVAFVPMLLFILFATVVILILFRLKLFWLWKAWFFLSVFVTLAISFNVFVGLIAGLVGALILALWRLFFPNFLVNNFTEMFIYGAMATIFVPILNILSIFLLLAFISVYDYIAVRKTKHMIDMARSQEKTKLFAGLTIPYGKNLAILGGGDIGFPLMFAAVVMMHFNLGLLDYRTYLIPIFSGMMLLALFVFGEKKKFYPAMPYLTLGCIVGLGILLFFV
jgi:presenilin-like A22 family membrane protease